MSAIDRCLFQLTDGDVSSGDFRDSVFCEGHTGDASAEMLRTRDAKIVMYHKTNEGELYDLASDPGEHSSLWNDPEHADLQKRMTERLAARATNARCF